jgi:hypothetical protein
MDVDDAFGFAGGAGGIDDESREFGIQRRWRRTGPDGAHEIGIVQGQQGGFVRHGEASRAGAR